MDSGNCGPCGMNPKTKKPHMASHAARKPGKHSEAPKKEVPKGHVCAPCDHQDAIDKIKERYGANPPQDGDKDPSL